MLTRLASKLPRATRHFASMSVNPEDFTVVKEGKATILAPKEDKVFYNPIQQFNRDLSVMAIRAWLNQYLESRAGEKELRGKRRRPNGAPTPYMRILEGLSATGLRAVRYGHEIPGVAQVVANDLLPEAVRSINRSAAYNGLQETVVGHQGDAIKYMGSLADADRFHVVDLDPYGTAAPFLDSAVQLVRDHGLLLVTCTDAGVLAGNGYPEKCFALYGGNNLGNTPMGLELNHEAGLRLMLGAIAAAAARYKKCIEPVLSLSIDYYFRVFVRVTTSPLQVKRLALQTMLAYHCVGCGEIIEQRLGRVADKRFQTPRIAAVPGENCRFCARPFHVAGPMWGGPLHDAAFIDEVLRINSEASAAVYGTRERIKGMLTLARHELPQPFYFNLNQLCSFMRAPPVSIDEFTRAAGNLGHRVSLTHAKKNCVKTDAPWELVLQIIVAWLRRSNTRLLAELRARLAAETFDDKKLKLQTKIASLEADLGASANLTNGMVGARILETVTPNAAVDFDTANEQSDSVARLRRLKMVRYQENPTKDWGPKSRPSKK
ncbi:TRM-domain-containing protein [Metschnikowia bicuspidata var. bicuspidata NRRL YB-4993]|uniref:tRNA (guanine(26)-N(2))-dimethyltransferase n=1 Tax=Metschnikowia bicuspidata var. bicuspidata NRRL YB-4993 TaxID=869754 RepID=A0A1A0H9V7_9ASCO|nr:TRM-domain-containing protein [Metschnikowia bicuspidata var. bicuspidata NRRL YB-4993]OBA20658.1 TRM-domain-containing protein [Metschnikowia bicuspidata var. bicuspidata NRRL YB-4993]